MNNELTAVQVIKGVKKLIGKRENWTSCIAENGYGYSDMYFSPEAKCFCVIGAVARVIDPNGDEGARFCDDEGAYHVFAKHEVGKIINSCAAARKGITKPQKSITATDTHITWTLNDNLYHLGEEGHAQLMDLLDEAYIHAKAAGV